MTVMSAPSKSTGFHIGYVLGTISREFLRAIKRPAVPAQQAQPTVCLTPTRNDWDELCRIPTLARSGVDLNTWFDTNTKAVPPTKRRTRKRKSSKPESAELRMGSLDELIAPVAEI